jgi:hypothetical protein
MRTQKNQGRRQGDGNRYWSLMLVERVN